MPSTSPAPVVDRTMVPRHACVLTPETTENVPLCGGRDFAEVVEGDTLKRGDYPRLPGLAQYEGGKVKVGRGDAMIEPNLLQAGVRWRTASPAWRAGASRSWHRQGDRLSPGASRRDAVQ